MLSAPAETESLRARFLQHWMLVVLGIMGAAVLFWMLTPVVAAHTHRAKGYESLTQALEVLDLAGPDYCVAGGIGVGRAKGLVHDAIESLEAAHRVRPADPQTLLLLGRARCLSGDFEGAVAAYRAYTELRPDNPLGHLELGFGYEVSNQYIFANEQWRIAELSIDNFIEKSNQINTNQFIAKDRWYERALMFEDYEIDDFSEVSGDRPFVIESFVILDHWKTCSWCTRSDGQYSSTRGVLQINTKAGFAVVFNGNISIENDQLLLRLKGTPNTVLTVEIVLDNIRQRLISYQAVPEKWTVLELDLVGKNLSEILISANKNETTTSQKAVTLFVDWIALKK